jgi:ribonuclease HI
MIVYFDGGCKPNPGKMEIGLVFVGDDGTKVNHKEHFGQGTNNQAEWLALIVGLSMLSEMGVREITMIGDSQLVCMQASGKWKMKLDSPLYHFWAEFKELEKLFTKIEIKHVLRDKNLAGIMLEQ